MAPHQAGQALRFRLTILLALMLGGCVFGGGDIVDTADFQAAGIHDALVRSGAALRPADAGFSVPAALVPAEWSGATVGFVDWRPDDARVARMGPGRIEIMAPDDDAMREMLRVYLSNVTTAEGVRESAIEGALLANRTSMDGYGQGGEPVAAPPGDPATGGFFYNANLPIEADLSRAFETVGGVEGAQPRSGVGFVGLGRDGWEIGVQLPRRSWERDGVTLSADPRDHAHVSIVRESADASAGESLARLDAALRELGLPPSGLSTTSFVHVV